jgi:hypothetical protein
VPKVLLACHYDVVQALPADRANQTFSIAALPWRACRCRMIANAKRANSTNEYTAVTSILIADQIARDWLPPTIALDRRSCLNARIVAKGIARVRNSLRLTAYLFASSDLDHIA